MQLWNISKGVVIGFSTCYIIPRCFEAANHHETLNGTCIQAANYVIIDFRQRATEIDKKKVLAIDE
ncbi:MAG: hypothetical protein K0Q73_7995, partial [Paenibacillus sp.]|nr:hypothetical protein [Paenibacillus sp.]